MNETQEVEKKAETPVVEKPVVAEPVVEEPVVEQPENPNVEIIALAADIETIQAEEGMTVAAALKKTAQKITVPKNGKITVNGAIAALTTMVKGGDKIIVSPKNRNG